MARGRVPPRLGRQARMPSGDRGARGRPRRPRAPGRPVGIPA